MKDCVFCLIAQGQIPSTILYEDEDVLCFQDANPQAEHHYLVIPKAHFKDLNDLVASEAGQEAATKLAIAWPKIIKALGLPEDSYRVINNCGKEAGQSVFHVHFHILADETKLTESLI